MFEGALRGPLILAASGGLERVLDPQQRHTFRNSCATCQLMTPLAFSSAPFSPGGRGP